MLTAFFCYRKQNTSLVSSIISRINEQSHVLKTNPADHDCFVRLVCDFHLQGGDHWDERLKSDIDNCDLMFVLVTAELVGDNSSYLTTVEIPKADAAGVPIVPIIYEGVLSQLDLHPVARRHAIPDGGQPPSRLGGEARWMERLITAIDKRCFALLRQQKLVESDNVILSLLSVKHLVDQCEALATSHNRDMTTFPRASIDRTLSIIKKIIKGPCHSLIPTLRASSDQLKLLRVVYARQSEIATALSQVQLAVDEAWTHAVLADYPIPTPVSDDGVDPIAMQGILGASRLDLKTQLAASTAKAQGVCQVAGNVSNDFLRKTAEMSCDNVSAHNELAEYMLDQTHIDTGLLAHVTKGAYDEAVILNETTHARQIAEEALKNSTMQLTSTAATTLATTKQMVIQVKLATCVETVQMRSDQDRIEYNSNFELGINFKKYFADTVTQKLFANSPDSRIKLTANRSAKGEKIKVVIEFRTARLGIVQSNGDGDDIYKAAENGFHALIRQVWKRNKRKKDRRRQNQIDE